jgi:hypothetical protein
LAIWSSRSLPGANAADLDRVECSIEIKYDGFRVIARKTSKQGRRWGTTASGRDAAGDAALPSRRREMKTLFLVRHAKSSWEYTALPDKDRPLNDRGKRDAPKMGKRLAKRDVKPDLILSSPARRALTTAEIIAKKLNYKRRDIGG